MSAEQTTGGPALPAVPEGWLVVGPPERVLAAGDCTACPACGELLCPCCQEHYADCPGPGPHSDLDDGWLVSDCGTWAWRVEERRD